MPAPEGTTRVRRVRQRVIDPAGCDFYHSDEWPDGGLTARGAYSIDDVNALDSEKRLILFGLDPSLRHFTPSKTVKFLECMQRHLSQDGLLIITNHGEDLAKSLDASRLTVNQYNFFGYGYEGSAEYADSIIS